MWNIICVALGLIALTSATGYPQDKPSNPLELPGSGTNVGGTVHPGYPKEVPDNPLHIQIPTVQMENVAQPDTIGSNTNRGGFSTNLQTEQQRPDEHHHDHHHHYHGEDGHYNPHDDGTGWDIRKSVPGEPGRDYPTYGSVPTTQFSCAQKKPGYYADEESRCQVFRVCTTGSVSAFNSFLCPNGSLFNQAVLTCDWWMNVDCQASSNFYYKNDEIGKMPEGSKLMYEINKMLEAPKLHPYKFTQDKSIAENQIQDVKGYQDLYIPPKKPFVFTTTTTQRPTIAEIKYKEVKTTTTPRPIVVTTAQVVTTSASPYIPPPPPTPVKPITSQISTSSVNLMNNVQTQKQNTLHLSQQVNKGSKQQLHLSNTLQTTPPLHLSKTTTPKPMLHVSQLVTGNQPQPLFTSQLLKGPQQQQEQLFTSKLINKQPQPVQQPQLFLSEEQKKLYTSQLVPKVPGAPATTEQKVFVSEVRQQVPTPTGPGYDYQKPSITVTKEHTKTVTHSEKTTHTIHNVQSGPEKISLVGDKTQGITSTNQGVQQQSIFNRQQVGQEGIKQQGVQQQTVQQGVQQQGVQQLGVQNQGVYQLGVQQLGVIPQGVQQQGVQRQQQEVQQQGVLGQTFGQSVQQQSQQQSGTLQQSGGLQKTVDIQTSTNQLPQTQSQVTNIQQSSVLSSVPALNSLTGSGITASDIGVQELTKEQALNAINKLQSEIQTISTQGDIPALNFGFGKLDIRDNLNNGLPGPSKGLDVPFQNRYTNVGFEGQHFQGYPARFGQEFQGYQQQQGYQQPSFHNPNFHEQNVQNYNYQLKTNIPQGQYQVFKDGSATNFKGETVSQHASGHSHSTYSGHNIAYKESTKVDIVPALGFTLTDNIGRNDYISAVLSGLLQDRPNLQGSSSDSISTGAFSPSDVRYSSYHGPSSYLVPQSSVQQLASDSGVGYHHHGYKR